jgi:uncharacterized protein YndB with AHSA1/START domain
MHNSNHMVVKGALMAARREIEVEATPEEVWEALATEEGRERWLEDEPDREIHVEVADEPSRLVWWWWSGEDQPTRVEFLVVAVPRGTRVLVTETVPSFPLAMFAASFAFAIA